MSQTTVDGGPSDDLMSLARSGGLAALRLGGRTLLPIVQGGMGVGISAHWPAAWLRWGGGDDLVGRLAPAPPRPDGAFARPVAWRGITAEAKRDIDAADFEALEREIRVARGLSAGRGRLAINVMRALSEYAPSVLRELECGIDAVVVGAGLPLDLPDLARDHPPALLLPILSDARGVQKPRCTMAFACLAQCGLRDGLAGRGQFCIDKQPAAALRDDVKKRLFFRGDGALPFGARYAVCAN
jgi:nitronate monooxygenase